MGSEIQSFLHFIFIGFIALFPVINPLGSAFIVSPYFSGLTKKGKINAVKKVSFYAFCVCLFTLLAGHWILELFGLTIPIIQLAGGIMICKIGWDFLSPSKQVSETIVESDDETINPDSSIEGQLFYPITFPISTGAGTISVLFTLSARSSSKNMHQYLVNMGAVLIAVIALCILIFVCYLNAHRLINYLGSHREKIVNSVMAFLIFCVGLQIAIDGIIKIVKPLTA